MAHAFSLNRYPHMSKPSNIGLKNIKILRSGDFGPDTDNPLIITSGISSLGPNAIGDLVLLLINYDSFSDHDDPYGHRDFGTLKYLNNYIYFKIDTLDSSSHQITLMLSTEW